MAMAMPAGVVCLCPSIHYHEPGPFCFQFSSRVSNAPACLGPSKSLKNASLKRGRSVRAFMNEVMEVAAVKEVIEVFTPFRLEQEQIKSFYMAFSLVFCWGCCVFASMNDPYYESEDYRGAGGNGTQHWFYDKEEDDEQDAREELFREELLREIEQKVGEMRELEDKEEEKEKELV